MNFISMPDLVLILWMAMVLATLRGKRQGHFIPLWIIGLAMIVVEGVARALYLQHSSMRQHIITHIIALDAYFFAGVAFYQSAIERLRSTPRTYLHLAVCGIPYLLLLTGYGAALTTKGYFVAVALFGLSVGLFAAIVFVKSMKDAICHICIWLPILGFSLARDYRNAAYFALFAVFAAVAVTFYFALKANLWGRIILIGGFSIWALCFLSHPWIATTHKSWAPMTEKIWDLQKFVVTFGLLILTLEETSAANEYDALHDTLTALPNRRLFVDRLQQDLARARRGDSRVFVFNIDLDKFKAVNDNWGHEAGDFLLREVASRLRTVTRETDTLARVGGDEFYLIVNDGNVTPTDNDIDLPAYLIQVLRSSVEAEPCIFELNGAHIHLHARLSIGHAAFPENGGTSDSLCRIADMRMYEDKRERNASGATASSPRRSAVPAIRESNSKPARIPAQAPQVPVN